MAHVIRRIEVLSIPAGWEPHVGHDAGRARLVWKVHRLGEPGAQVLKTGIRELSETGGLLLAPVGSFADEHAESLFKGGHLGRLLVVGQPILHVVDGHAAVGPLEADVGYLWDPVVGTISGTEEEYGGPVVGEVFRELAGCASGLLPNVFLGVHGDVEGILVGIESINGTSVVEGKDKTYATDDLVKMRRGRESRVDEWIDTLHGELRAAKSDQRCRRRHKRERGK